MTSLTYSPSRKTPGPRPGQDSFFQSMNHAPEPLRHWLFVSNSVYLIATQILDRPFQSKTLLVFSCFDSPLGEPRVLSRDVPDQEVFVVVRGRLRKDGEWEATLWVITTNKAHAEEVTRGVECATLKII